MGKNSHPTPLVMALGPKFTTTFFRLTLPTLTLIKFEEEGEPEFPIIFASWD